MPGNETWKGFTLKPKFYADIKTGEILDCADSLRRDVETPKQIKKKSPAQAAKDKPASIVWVDVPQVAVQDSKKAAGILDCSCKQHSLTLII